MSTNGGQSHLAVNAAALGLQLPPQFYFKKQRRGWGGETISVQFIKPKLPHAGQIKKLQRRGFKLHK